MSASEKRKRGIAIMRGALRGASDLDTAGSGASIKASERDGDRRESGDYMRIAASGAKAQASSPLDSGSRRSPLYMILREKGEKA